MTPHAPQSRPEEHNQRHAQYDTSLESALQSQEERLSETARGGDTEGAKDVRQGQVWKGKVDEGAQTLTASIHGDRLGPR